MQTDLARPGAFVVVAAAMLAGSYVMAPPATTTPGAGEPTLAEVWAHTERFRDVPGIGGGLVVTRRCAQGRSRA